ncbi:MAG: hypothetical protein ACPGF8_05420 [Opitutales bacterium]
MINIQIKTQKQKASAAIARQTAEFIAAGKAVTQVPTGISGLPDSGQKKASRRHVNALKKKDYARMEQRKAAGLGAF